MKIVLLKGGLGNQMFQYACCRNMLNNKSSVYIDLSFIQTHTNSSGNFTARKYELLIFENAKVRLLNVFTRRLFLDTRYRYSIIRKLLGLKVEFVRQIENEFVGIKKEKNMYLDGYFQSEIYFKDIRNIILQDFRFPFLDDRNEAIRVLISNAENPVCLHFRRGDYLKPGNYNYHGCLPMAYYINSVDRLKLKYKNLHFFVFSDDNSVIDELKWLDDNNITYVLHNRDRDCWKDMCLMSYCKHHIIANSSFSWWGAWLSERRGDKFAPKNWFNPQSVKFDINHIVPNNWQIVNYD